MADSYTPSLRIAQQTIGGNENNWGTILNASLAALDQGIAGIVSISVTAGNVTLTTANNADDQARNALIVCTGTPGATRTVTMPDVKKLTWVFNSSDSSITLTVGAGTTVSLPAGATTRIYTDGATNVVNLLSRIFVNNISFPSTAVRITEANTLDAYLEQAWTPTIAFGGGTTGITYSFQNGYTIQIGSFVFFSAHILLTSKGSLAGALTLEGLPIISSSSPNRNAAASIAVDGVNTTAFYQGYVNVNATNVAIEKLVAGAASAVTDNDLTNTTKLKVSGHYRAGGL